MSSVATKFALFVAVIFSPALYAQQAPDEAKDKPQDSYSESDTTGGTDTRSAKTRREEMTERVRRRTCNFGSVGPVCRSDVRGNAKSEAETTTPMRSPTGTFSLDVSTIGLLPPEANEELERQLRLTAPAIATCVDIAFYEDSGKLPSLRVLFSLNTQGKFVQRFRTGKVKVEPGDSALQQCVKSTILGLSMPAPPETLAVDARYAFHLDANQPGGRGRRNDLKAKTSVKTTGLPEDESQRIEAHARDLEACVTNSPAAVPGRLLTGEVEFEAEYCNGLRKVSITSSTAPTWVDNCVRRTIWCSEKNRRIKGERWSGKLEYSR